jgi:quercetin dioxygenase-like cupin family protein
VEIRRFGPGHRRKEGPPGTQGLVGQVIWSDERAHISELAFSRRGAIAPHDNPNQAVFIVVSGGGWVQVGDERVPINHGEAVVWPAGVPHGAYTDGSEMRVIIVELTGDPPASGLVAKLLPGSAREIDPDGVVGRARGSLAERAPDPVSYDRSEGEPW